MSPGLTQQVRRVALYYPDVAPPDGWIRRSLLFYDALSSLVSPSFLKQPPPRFTWLLERGYFIPLTVDQLPSMRVRALAQKLEERVPHLPDEGALRSEVLYSGKVPDLILGHLRNRGLLGHDPAGARVSPLLQQVLLGAIAQELATHRSSFAYGKPTFYSVHTEQETVERWLVDAVPGHQVLQALDVLVSGLVPTPPPDATYEEILDFRDRHQVALRDLWTSLVQMVTPGQQDNVLHLRSTVEAAVSKLDEDQRYRNWLAFGATVVVGITGVGLGLEPHLFTNAQVQATFSGLGVAASVAVGSRLLSSSTDASRIPTASFRYLQAARKRFDS